MDHSPIRPSISKNDSLSRPIRSSSNNNSISNNNTPTRPPFPRPSSINDKIKLQQRLNLNHLNSSSLSLSSLSNSTILHGIQYNKKNFGIESSIKEDDDNDNDDNVLQFSSLKLEKYQSTLTVPGLNIFHNNNNNNNNINDKSINNNKHNNNNSNEYNGNEIEFKSHIDVEDKVKTVYGIDEIAESLALGEIEFCYIKQCQDDPYKFYMINKPSNIITTSYCTVSKNGIVRYTSKGSEYEELSEFMGDLIIFNKLKELRVFKEHRLWKTMLIWKKGIKERKYIKYKELLINKYFLLEQRFQSRIPFIMDRCDELKNIRILNLDIDHHIDIKEFLNIQAETIDKATKIKNKIFNAIVDYLTTQIADDNMKIIKKVTDTLNKKTTFNYNNNNSYRRSKKAKGTDFESKSMTTSVDFFEPTVSTTTTMQQSVSFFDSNTIDQSSIVTKSLYADNASNYENNSKYIPEVGLSYTDRANIRGSCRKLASFLRVTDFIIRDALYESVSNNLQKMYSFMSSFRNNDNSTGLFPIKLMLIHENDNVSHNSNMSGNNYTVYFDIQPNADYFMQLFQSFLYNSNAFGCHIKSLISEYFIDSLAPIANEVEELHLFDIINDRGNTISIYSNQCLTLLGQDFNNLMAKISKFQYLCTRYTETSKYIKSTSPSSLENMLVEDINELLSSTEKDLLEYLSMQSLYDIGLLRLDLIDVKNLMINKTKEKLSLLHNIIPIIHNKIEDNFSTELYHLTTTLEKSPESLDDFIILLEVFNGTTKESDRLYSEFSRLTGFYDLFTEYKINSINDIMISKYVSLSNLWYKYNDTILEFENLLDSRFKTYRSLLKNRVTIIMKPVEEGKLFLNNDLIVSPESNPNDIIPELQKLYDTMQNIRDESNIIEKYQILMQTSVFSIVSIRDVIDAVSSNFKLWTSVKVLKNLTTTLNSEFFKEIDSNKILKDLQTVAHNLIIINENFNYIVRSWVSNSLDDLKKIIPVLQMLQTETLKQRHIERLTDSFGRDIYTSNNGRGDTVSILIKDRIIDFSSLIDTLSLQSRYEYNVELKMIEISSLCDTKEFTFENQATVGVCITNFDELKEFLENNLYWAECCIQSKHAMPHFAELSILFSILKGCIPNLEFLRTIQMGYIQLRIIFTNARTARHLSHAMKYFQIVDDVWRQVIGILRIDSRIMELFRNTEIFEKMKTAIDAVEDINKCMDQYLEDQCSQWPKLYIMDRSSLIDAITTNDPHQTFHKTKALIPALSQLKLILDNHGSFLAEGFISQGNESLNFLHPCSVRSSLADWMKTLESALGEKLKHDIVQLVDGKINPFEDLQKPRLSDQARLVYFQTAFWNLVYQGLQSTSKNRAMKPLLQELSDQIFTCTNLNNSVSTTYQILSVANTITLLMYEREFVEKLLDDPDSEIPATGFLIENALKKRYHSTTSSIIIQQGRFQIPYGFSYHGGGERLILTALTERCWLSMSIAFQNVNVPFVTSGNGQFKRVMVDALSRELGADSFIMDCSLAQNPESIFRAIRSSFASNLFMTFCNAEKLNLEMQSILFTQLMTTCSAISGGAEQLNIGGHLTEVKAVANGQLPRISIIYNLSNKNIDPNLPATVRATFRPIQLAPPCYPAMFKVLLTAYSYWDITKSAIRLSALCEFIAINKNIDNRSVCNLAVSCIKSVGTMMLMKSVVVMNKHQLVRVAQEIIKNIVYIFQKHFTDDDLRYISNLFLGYKFKPDQDRMKFKPQKKSPSDILVEFITNNQSIDSDKIATSIVVVGGVGVGKSNLISSAIDKALIISADKVKCHKFNGLNPFLMTDLCNHNKFLKAASDAMDYVIDKIEPFGAIEIMHLDLHSSHELIGVLGSAESYAQTSHKSIKFVWECTELTHMDPSALSSIHILHIKSRSFSLSDAIAHKLQLMWPSTSDILSSTLQQCTSTHLMPCLQNAPSDSFLSTFSLAENVLLMFNDIYNASDIASKINDNYSLVITKIFIFSCIWTIGAGSPTSQEQFDKWFKQHLKRVFPVVLRGGPLPIPLSFLQDGLISFVHHYYLQTVDGDEILEWTPCSKLQMFIDSTTASDNDLAKRILKTKLPPHSYSHYYGSNQSSLVVSTHTGEAVSYIHRCILTTGFHSSSSLMLLGCPGTGKSSLIKQLYSDFITSATSNKALNFSFKTTDKRSSSFQRWVCLICDSNHQDISEYITTARNNISESMIQERWPDEGIIFIEDVNIRNDFDFEGSCAEWLRTLNEHKKIFDFKSRIWRDRRDVYSVCTANSVSVTSSVINERLVRHSFCITLDETDIHDVFSVKLCSACPTLHEVSDDLVMISFKLFTTIKKACHEFLIDVNTPLQERIFSSIISGQSVSSILENVFDIMIKSLLTLSGFTSYDALRVYDRVINDYFAFIPCVEDVLGKTLVTLYHSSQRYKFQGFSDRIKREIDMREEACQKLEIGRANNEEYTNDDLNDLKLLDKYTTGYTKNGTTYYLGLVNPEYIRDNYINNFITSIPMIISKPPIIKEENLGFFMDIQRLATQIIPINNHDNNHPYSIITGQEYSYVQHIIKSMTSLHKLTFYHFITIFDNNDINRFIDEEVDLITDFLENCNYFLKNKVNMDMSSKSLLSRKSRSTNSSRSSFVISPDDDDDDVNSETFFTRYPTMARIWHVHLCSTIDTLEDNDWSTFIDIIELKNKILINKLIALGLPDIRKSSSSRKLINYYMKKQFYYFTFGNDTTIMAKSNRFFTSPSIIKKFRFFNLSPATSYLRNFYKHVFSQSRYILIDNIIDDITKIISKAIINQNHHHNYQESNHLHDDHHHTDDNNEIIKMIFSKDFKMGSMQAIEYLYSTSKSHSDNNENGWINALNSIVKAISVGACQRYYSTLKSNTSNNNDDNDNVIFYDAVFNVIFSRYVMLVNEDRQNGVTQLLIKKFKAHNLPRSFDYDVLPLATGIVISQYQQFPFQSLVLDTVLNIARNLPEPSSLRRLLSAMGIMLICNCNKEAKSSIVGRIIDRSSMFSVLFGDIINVVFIPRVSSSLHHGDTRVLDIKLNIEVKGNNVHPMPLTDSNMWIFTINSNNKSLFELYLVSLMLQGHDVNPSLSAAYERFTGITDDTLLESEFDAFVENFKLVSTKFESQWLLTWKHIEKIVLTINAVLHGISISIKRRELPPEYQQVFLTNLKTNLDKGTANSHRNFKGALAKAVDSSIQILKKCLSEHSGLFFDVFIFWKLLIGGDHHHHESKKVLTGLCEYTDLGIKSNVESLPDTSYTRNVFLTKDSQDIITIVDNFIANTGKRHSVIGTSNTNTNISSLRMITSEERLSKLTSWIIDFPTVDINIDVTLTLLEKFVIGYILKPLSLPQFLTQAISELGHISNIMKDHYHQYSNNSAVVYNPSGYVDIKNIYRSKIPSFELECYVGVTTNSNGNNNPSNATNILINDDNDVLFSSNNHNNDLTADLSDTMTILVCMGQSIDFDFISKYINNSNNRLVETSQMIDRASDNMNSITVVHVPTCTNDDSFLAILEHSLKVVKDMPIVIINFTPEKNVALSKANTELNEDKERKAMIVMENKASRIRSLLAIFHAAFVSRLHGGIGMLIGDDTLVCAVEESDQYLSLILSASLSSASSTTATETSFALLSGINDEACIEYIVNTLYLSLIHDLQQQTLAETLFRSIFRANSLDLSVPYYFRGGCLVPDDLDEDNIASLIKSVKLTLSETLQLHQLLGSSLSEISTIVSKNIKDGMNSMLESDVELDDNKFVMTSLPIPVLMRRIKNSIAAFENMLPSMIALDSDEIMMSIDRQSTANRLSRMEESNKKNANATKKGALHIKNEILDFDPMFAFLLAECEAYNNFIEGIQKQCKEVLSNDVIPFEHRMFLIDLVLVMETGMIPSVWIPSLSSSSSITINSWIANLTDRKSFLTSWLLTGIPSLVPFHLLANPSSLLHSLKESFAIKIESSPDRVHLTYRWLTIDSASTLVETVHNQNLGCSIIISPLSLMNAMLNEPKQQLTSLHSYHRDNRGEQVALLVNATVDFTMDGNVIPCPLYVTHTIPQNIKLFIRNERSIDDNDITHWVPFLFIPIEVDDQSISLAGPKLIIG